MAHLSYKTKALVLGSFPRGEANSAILILTPDLGLIYVHAQGIRYEKSKLRSALADYSFSEVVLVYGKSGWRITNALPISNIFYSSSKEKIAVVGRAFKLIKKLIAGEESNPELFAVCLDSIEELSKEKDNEEVSRIETVWVLKILYYLGYIDGDSSVKKALNMSMNEASISKDFDDLKSEAVSQINRAIESSQLMF